jgi:hypothetical protein
MGRKPRKWGARDPALPALAKRGMLHAMGSPKLRPAMRIGLIAGVLAAAVLLGIGLGLYYRAVSSELAELRSQLVTEAQLARPDDPETTAAIKRAPQLCERVYDLRENFLARLLNRAELKDLWRHCEHIADVAAGLDKIDRKTPE